MNVSVLTILFCSFISFLYVFLVLSSVLCKNLVFTVFSPAGNFVSILANPVRPQLVIQHWCVTTASWESLIYLDLYGICIKLNNFHVRNQLVKFNQPSPTSELGETGERTTHPTDSCVVQKNLHPTWASTTRFCRNTFSSRTYFNLLCSGSVRPQSSGHLLALQLHSRKDVFSLGNLASQVCI